MFNRMFIGNCKSCQLVSFLEMKKECDVYYFNLLYYMQSYIDNGLVKSTNPYLY